MMSDVKKDNEIIDMEVLGMYAVSAAAASDRRREAMRPTASQDASKDT